MSITFSGTTSGEAKRMRRLADLCGGYHELGRVLKERGKIGPSAQLRRCENGRLTYLPVGQEPPPEDEVW